MRMLYGAIAWRWLVPAVHGAEGTGAFAALHGLSIGPDPVTTPLGLWALDDAGRARLGR